MNIKLPEVITELSTPVLAALVVLVVVELALLVAAWIKIAKTPKEQVRFGSKLVWVLISLINGVGPIATLIMIAEPARVAEPEQTSPSSSTEVADLLYGSKDADSKGEAR